jgi:hypothetical protein
MAAPATPAQPLKIKSFFLLFAKKKRFLAYPK